MGRTNTPPDLLPGTLDLLILRTLATGPKHGYGIAERLRQVSEDVLQVGESSLYPALQRLLLERLGQGGMGRVGEQPPRALLHGHPRGPQAARGGTRGIRASRRRDPTGPADGVKRLRPERGAASPRESERGCPPPLVAETEGDQLRRGLAVARMD